MTDAPPLTVLEAFGVSATVVRLSGGQGTCWQAGDLVLKPGQPSREASWCADLFAELSGPGFRVPQPVRSRTGSWTVAGWTASRRVPGEPAPVAHWSELVATSRGFHTALAGIAMPPWLGRRRNPWVLADAMAWGADRVELKPELAALVEALLAATRPIRLPAQLVHGDIAGNVLFAADGPPAVIDFSPYWHPAGYALAIAAVDVLAWSGAPPAILDELDDEPEIDQLLVRALASRLITESLIRKDHDTLHAVRRANQTVVERVLSRIAGASPIP
ncbi:MAG TPA: phosphotransferase [Jatrophihabitantaceae bacterium]